VAEEVTTTDSGLERYNISLYGENSSQTLEEKNIRSQPDKNRIPGCVQLECRFLTDPVMADCREWPHGSLHFPALPSSSFIPPRGVAYSDAIRFVVDRCLAHISRSEPHYKSGTGRSPHPIYLRASLDAVPCIPRISSSWQVRPCFASYAYLFGSVRISLAWGDSRAARWAQEHQRHYAQGPRRGKTGLTRWQSEHGRK